MSESVLTNPGFYGADGRQWPFIGQIADDSTWRDNILPGKFSSPETIPGYGRRYKIRIMGVHDQEQETIPDDQLPWATIEYPTTAGSGGGSSFQTSQLRQGMFVSGYFMDGADQNVPVITGVLGQNAQTGMSMSTGMTGGKAFSSQSGFAKTKKPYKGSSKPKVPDEGLVTGEQSKETANPAPGSVLNKFGISGSPTPKQLAMISSAMASPSATDLAGTALNEFVKSQVKKGTKDLKAQEGLASRGPISNATKENPDAVHQLSAADLKRDEKMCEKIATMKGDDIVGSAMKAIQTETENLSKKLESTMEILKSYQGAVAGIGSPMGDMQKAIGDAACQIAKYMKIVFDKIMNYVLKIVNKNMTKVVSALPSSMRYQMSDMKDIIGELTLCMYGKITNSLCGTIAGMLTNMMDPDNMEKKAREDADTPQDPDAPNTYVKVPMCTAEEMVGQVLAMHKDQINDANNTLIDNVNAFLDEMQSELAGVSGAMSDIMTKMGGISGNMTSALGFANIKLNVFGCELNPAPAMSDYYTLCRGGASAPQQQLPSNKAVEERADDTVKHTVPSEQSYVEPTKGQKDVSTETKATYEDDEDDDGTKFDMF